SRKQAGAGLLNQALAISWSADQLSASALVSKSSTPISGALAKRYCRSRCALCVLMMAMTSRELLCVEWGTAGDEQVDLVLRRLMNQVRTALRPNGSTQAFGIDVELRGQLGNQGINLPLVDCRDDVNVKRGPRLPGE